MAVKMSRVELNLSKLAEAEQAVAQGVLALGESIAREAASTVPVSDDPRFGHIKDNWGVAVYYYGKKVGNASSDGTATAKPRSLRTDKQGVMGFVGFGFPGRFLEMGTSDTRAQPFLSPAGQRADVNVAVEAIKRNWPR